MDGKTYSEAFAQAKKEICAQLEPAAGSKPTSPSPGAKPGGGGGVTVRRFELALALALALALTPTPTLTRPNPSPNPDQVQRFELIDPLDGRVVQPADVTTGAAPPRQVVRVLPLALSN